MAGHSLRALRLDLELAVLHYLQDLPSNKWACEEEEATEVLPLLYSQLFLNPEAGAKLFSRDLTLSCRSTDICLYVTA